MFKSGPQFPTPSSLQQRYCYPRGDSSYSNEKGGALWTAYKSDGTEDLEFRILHVYYSAKRAGTKHPLTSSKQSESDKFISKKKAKVEDIPDIPKLPPPMPGLQTPHPTSFDSAFGSSFDDSPLSFNVALSPIKDKSFVQLLRTASSIDTESDPISTPGRNFFDIRTEFEKANGIVRHQNKPKYDNSVQPKTSHSYQQHPYWGQHYHSMASDSFERQPRHWHPGYWSRGGGPHKHFTNFPTQQPRDIHYHIPDHVSELLLFNWVINSANLHFTGW